MHSCPLHICIIYACGLCICCECMVVDMVAVVSPCEIRWCVVGCGHHECMLVMHWLCMIVLMCCYTYINMVIVVVHEIMVCGWYGDAW